MANFLTPDLCIIGAGSGGLSVAAGASQMGAETVLIERGEMGGDCLNTGCVPSKSLLAAAHAAEEIRNAHVFGIQADAPRVDFPAVQRHVKQVIAAIAPNDSVARYEGLGVKVIQETAYFVNRREVEAGRHAYSCAAFRHCRRILRRRATDPGRRGGPLLHERNDL